MSGEIVAIVSLAFLGTALLYLPFPLWYASHYGTVGFAKAWAIALINFFSIHIIFAIIMVVLFGPEYGGSASTAPVLWLFVAEILLHDPAIDDDEKIVDGERVKIAKEYYSVQGELGITGVNPKIVEWYNQHGYERKVKRRYTVGRLYKVEKDVAEYLCKNGFAHRDTSTVDAELKALKTQVQQRQIAAEYEQKLREIEELKKQLGEMN